MDANASENNAFGFTLDEDEDAECSTNDRHKAFQFAHTEQSREKKNGRVIASQSANAEIDENRENLGKHWQLGPIQWA